MHSPPSYPHSEPGADVIHPAPGTKSVPSFGALVSSLSPNAANYVAMDSIQHGRKELIADLQPMIQV
jgi:eukaryotic translation initiation factor 2C